MPAPAPEHAAARHGPSRRREPFRAPRLDHRRRVRHVPCQHLHVSARHDSKDSLRYVNDGPVRTPGVHSTLGACAAGGRPAANGCRRIQVSLCTEHALQEPPRLLRDLGRRRVRQTRPAVDAGSSTSRLAPGPPHVPPRARGRSCALRLGHPAPTPPSGPGDGGSGRRARAADRSLPHWRGPGRDLSLCSGPRRRRRMARLRRNTMRVRPAAAQRRPSCLSSSLRPKPAPRAPSRPRCTPRPPHASAAAPSRARALVPNSAPTPPFAPCGVRLIEWRRDGSAVVAPAWPPLSHPAAAFAPPPRATRQGRCSLTGAHHMTPRQPTARSTTPMRGVLLHVRLRWGGRRVSSRPQGPAAATRGGILPAPNHRALARYRAALQRHRHILRARRAGTERPAQRAEGPHRRRPRRPGARGRRFPSQSALAEPATATSPRSS
jgi:hypothetical protein